MPPLALSTCWNSDRHTDGYAMLREIADLGFEVVELSHGIRLTLVPGILRALADKVVRVGSTHNFCPLPTGISRAAPNLYQPSGPTEAEREMWVRQTVRSIDFAAEVGAGVVVVHLGSVGYRWFHPGRRLRAWRRNHPGILPSEDSRFRRLLARVDRRRQRNEPVWRARMLATVPRVAAHAREKGIRLGFENRERWEELPRDDDFEAVFAELPPDVPAGVWFDTGHARIKQDFGAMQPVAWLESLGPRLLGFHLHDVDAEGHDHRAVGAGEIDFASLARFVRADTRLVLELAPDVTADDVTASRDRLRALGLG